MLRSARDHDGRHARCACVEEGGRARSQGRARRRDVVDKEDLFSLHRSRRADPEGTRDVVAAVPLTSPDDVASSTCFSDGAAASF